MSLYNSFSRLGQKLERSTTLAELAWPWLHYDGILPQSYQEWMIGKARYVPMAWVWSEFKAVKTRDHHELVNQQSESQPSTRSGYSVSNDREPIILMTQDNSIVVDRMDRLRTQKVLDNNEIRSGDIIKLVASLAFAASIIGGVFLMGGPVTLKQKDIYASQIGKKTKNIDMISTGSLKK